MVDLETFVSSESNLLDCVRFHFMSILRKELTGISIEWNPQYEVLFLLYQAETTPHLVNLTLCTFHPIFMELYTAWSVLTLPKSTNLLILPALYPLTTLMRLLSLQRHWWMNNIMEMSNDASKVFSLYLYLLSKIEEYSQTALNVFDFASIKFLQFLPNCETKYTRNYKHFVTAKFCFCEMQNIFNEKQDRKDFE